MRRQGKQSDDLEKTCNRDTRVHDSPYILDMILSLPSYHSLGVWHAADCEVKQMCIARPVRQQDPCQMMNGTEARQMD